MRDPRQWLVLLILGVSLGGCQSEQAPFAFEDVRVEELAADRAVVRFNTSVPTTCELVFGTAPNALTERAEDPSMADNTFALVHEVPLEGLAPAQRYYFRPFGSDETGASAQGALSEFETLAATEAPDPGTNLAALSAGTTVLSVSSNFGGAANDAQWGIDSALDDDLRTAWASAGEGDAATFELDLGQVRTIGSLAVRSRSMSDGSSIVTAFELSGTNGQRFGPFETPEATVRYRFALPETWTTQRVRFTILSSTGGNTGLLDFALFE